MIYSTEHYFYDQYIMCWEAIRLCCREMFGVPSVNIYESRRYNRSPSVTNVREAKALESIRQALLKEEEEEVIRFENRCHESSNTHDEKVETDSLHQEVRSMLGGQTSRVGSESDEPRLRCDTPERQEHHLVRLSPSDQGSEWLYLSD